ncbi:uncharacterized protein LOC121734872 [Aricia agestis]|uniref:uncharacterized protein LOC121734872 n=1 Tax=Aricia agestis TaxID=91739 RepID=UPI001C204126|nr:uncharacterized protein LOC121734872 [Aricia agestis]
MALLIWLLLFKMVCAKENYASNGILHHINTGMNIAKDFLGSESVALKVADFVVRAFQPTKQHQRPSHFEESTENDKKFSEENEFNVKQSSSLSPWRHIVRLLGLQPNQISAVAVNALIFVAQMITTFLSGPRQPGKNFRAEDPFKFVLNKNSERLQQLLATAKNESLPDLINQIVEEQESQEETSCIKLLVCKLTPFIEKMQRTVFNDDSREEYGKIRGAEILYRHLPTSDEINLSSDICENKYRDCNLHE